MSCFSTNWFGTCKIAHFDHNECEHFDIRWEKTGIEFYGYTSTFISSMLFCHSIRTFKQFSVVHAIGQRVLGLVLHSTFLPEMLDFSVSTVWREWNKTISRASVRAFRCFRQNQKSICKWKLSVNNLVFLWSQIIYTLVKIIFLFWETPARLIINFSSTLKEV